MHLDLSAQRFERFSRKQEPLNKLREFHFPKKWKNSQRTLQKLIRSIIIVKLFRLLMILIYDQFLIQNYLFLWNFHVETILKLFYRIYNRSLHYR